ncbi:MAG: winged helix-turn-helix transcriptional regulator [Caulobacter sp.]|nr:winged helix-turn-helix transcriptional regulator [Caulobacter sp.]
MNVGPNIALVASLLGDPARASMLTALMDHQALTAGELARHAGVTPQTASSHLARLLDGGLVVTRKQGRHSYFALAGADVAAVLEGLMGLASRAGHQRVRTGPREPALRQARVCYDHLAGDLGVAMLEAMIADGRVVEEGDALTLTPAGAAFADGMGIEPALLRPGRRPVCKACLDWSVRRRHLAGTLGAALLTRFYELGWARREPDSRVVTFTALGRQGFEEAFGVTG